MSASRCRGSLVLATADRNRRLPLCWRAPSCRQKYRKTWRNVTRPIPPTCLPHGVAAACFVLATADKKAETHNHLSIHQWVRSAIFAPQQHASPIGFLFLKLPPPPCAVLLVLSDCSVGASATSACFGEASWFKSSHWQAPFSTQHRRCPHVVLINPKHPQKPQFNHFNPIANNPKQNAQGRKWHTKSISVDGKMNAKIIHCDYEDQVWLRDYKQLLQYALIISQFLSWSSRLSRTSAFRNCLAHALFTWITSPSNAASHWVSRPQFLPKHRPFFPFCSLFFHLEVLLLFALRKQKGTHCLTRREIHNRKTSRHNRPR